ncbi:uncharacterized protein LOC121624267 [Xyrichtys novacula]|uniref:Uncharacterized protein LOC121624267 n=1 Tax=Xyrichtys novacula TaxID=13765 RepID=A0AAV1GY72_XYRNO|nr:uncharacterized protein LOC121624267 [Xyrichtys novacula]
MPPSMPPSMPPPAYSGSQRPVQGQTRDPWAPEGLRAQVLKPWGRSSDIFSINSSSTGLFKLRTRGLFPPRPPATGRVKTTLIGNPAKATILDQELSSLLSKGAIEPVDPLSQIGGFHLTYFIITKKTADSAPF